MRCGKPSGMSSCRPSPDDFMEVKAVFHKAVDLRFLPGTAMEVRFENGQVKRYDMAALFDKYPQLRALEDRKLFSSGRLMGYGIMWTDELDIETETIYQDGISIRAVAPALNPGATAVTEARARRGLSQKQLASLCGIDQSDISKIERGLSNPSVATLQKIAKGLGGNLAIEIIVPSK